jgi:hypothetical protein
MQQPDVYSGYNSQRQGTARTIFVLFYVLFVLCRSVYCLCVNVYCTAATGWHPTAVNKYTISYHIIYIYIYDQLGDPGVDGRRILKWIFRK